MEYMEVGWNSGTRSIRRLEAAGTRRGNRVPPRVPPGYSPRLCRVAPWRGSGAQDVHVEEEGVGRRVWAIQRDSPHVVCKLKLKLTLHLSTRSTRKYRKESCAGPAGNVPGSAAVLGASARAASRRREPPAPPRAVAISGNIWNDPHRVQEEEQAHAGPQQRRGWRRRHRPGQRFRRRQNAAWEQYVQRGERCGRGGGRGGWRPGLAAKERDGCSSTAVPSGGC